MDNLRPCIITEKIIMLINSKIVEEKEERRGYFHQWENVSNIIEPSPLKGGHTGGVQTCTLAIVELEDGTVVRVYPYQIKFTDRGQEDKENAIRSE